MYLIGGRNRGQTGRAESQEELDKVSGFYPVAMGIDSSMAPCSGSHVKGKWVKGQWRQGSSCNSPGKKMVNLKGRNGEEEDRLNLGYSRQRLKRRRM
jgi:hypothetical protein